VTDADRIAGEKSLERLRTMAMSLLRENERLLARLGELYKQVAEAKGEAAAQLRLEIAALEREIEKRRESIFQHKSERRPADKGQDGEAPKPPQKGHGPREQPKLEVEEVVHDLDDADKTCTACGGDLEEWAGQFEESDEVEVIERRYVIKRHKRKKYRCRCGSCIETAPAPRRLIEGGRYSVSFAITVAVDKYLMHLPLERQVAAMARLGLEVDSQTLFDQLWALNRLLLPAYQRLADVQRARPLLFVDESRWPLLGVKGKGATSTKWHIWTLVSELGVYYEIFDGRDADSAEDLLADFKGYVMCDGFSAYESLAKAYPEIRLVQCWVHYPEPRVIRSRPRDAAGVEPPLRNVLRIIRRHTLACHDDEGSCRAHPSIRSSGASRRCGVPAAAGRARSASTSCGSAASASTSAMPPTARG